MSSPNHLLEEPAFLRILLQTRIHGSINLSLFELWRHPVQKLREKGLLQAEGHNNFRPTMKAEAWLNILCQSIGHPNNTQWEFIQGLQILFLLVSAREAPLWPNEKLKNHQRFLLDKNLLRRLENDTLEILPEGRELVSSMVIHDFRKEVGDPIPEGILAFIRVLDQTRALGVHDKDRSRQYHMQETERVMESIHRLFSGKPATENQKLILFRNRMFDRVEDITLYPAHTPWFRTDIKVTLVRQESGIILIKTTKDILDAMEKESPTWFHPEIGIVFVKDPSEPGPNVPASLRRLAFQARIYLSITRAQLNVIRVCAENHYDSTCKAAITPGHFLFGLANMLEVGEASVTTDGYPFSFGELDLLTKILEQRDLVFRKDPEKLKIGNDLRKEIGAVLLATNTLTPEPLDYPASAESTPEDH